MRAKQITKQHVQRRRKAQVGESKKHARNAAPVCQGDNFARVALTAVKVSFPLLLSAIAFRSDGLLLHSMLILLVFLFSCPRFWILYFLVSPKISLVSGLPFHNNCPDVTSIRIEGASCQFFYVKGNRNILRS